MRFQKLISAALLFPMTVAAVQAGVVAGRWEKVDALAPGTAVIVQLAGGERLECSIHKIETDAILFQEIRGRERRTPKSAILKIESAAVVRDRLRNGTLIGALMGAAGGLVGMVAYGSAKTSGPVAWGSEDGPAYLLGAALVGGGIGAATGAIVDASINRREVFYAAR